MKWDVITADVDHENIRAILIPADATFGLKIECGSCHTEAPNTVYVSSGETVTQQKGKDQEVNLDYRCKMCDRHSTITISPPAKYHADGEGRHCIWAAPIAQLEEGEEAFLCPTPPPLVQTFDCRGCEIKRCEIDTVIVRGPKTLFEPHSMKEDGEFAEFDEAADVPVTLNSISFAVNRSA